MGISNALNNASTGLRANSRLIDTISNNVANELTPGYARRETQLVSSTVNGYGSGVTALSTTRAESVMLTSERRLGDASAAAASVVSSAYSGILDSVGEPGAEGSLATMITDLESALLASAASPQSQALLQDVFTSAESLVDGINTIAASNMKARAAADAEIGRQVDSVNTALHQIDDLNKKIISLTVQGIDTLGLQDQRSQLIDKVSEMVPVRSVSRDNGSVALYTQNGGLLLDGSVFELKFTTAGDVISPDMAVGGALSVLQQDQNAGSGLVTVSTTGTGAMAGGSIAALFQVRDTIIPSFDADLDRLTAELVARFDEVQTGGTNDGLLVDSDPAAGQTGIASRLSLNAAVDPSQGGSLTALRSGIAGTESAEAGYGTHLQNLANALSASRTPTGWSSQNASADAATMASNLASYFATFATNTENDRAYLVARQASLVEQETNETGVNSDNELQSLMVVEQAYAANAKVLSVIDELMKLLLG